MEYILSHHLPVELRRTSLACNFFLLLLECCFSLHFPQKQFSISISPGEQGNPVLLKRIKHTELKRLLAGNTKSWLAFANSTPPLRVGANKDQDCCRQGVAILRKKSCLANFIFAGRRNLIQRQSTLSISGYCFYPLFSSWNRADSNLWACLSVSISSKLSPKRKHL